MIIRLIVYYHLNFKKSLNFLPVTRIMWFCKNTHEKVLIEVLYTVLTRMDFKFLGDIQTCTCIKINSTFYFYCYTVYEWSSHRLGHASSEQSSKSVYGIRCSKTLLKQYGSKIIKCTQHGRNAIKWTQYGINAIKCTQKWMFVIFWTIYIKYIKFFRTTNVKFKWKSLQENIIFL